MDPELATKTAAAREFIASVLATFARPAVLWSGGKDSMVLLHLIRSVRPDLPVLFFREPAQPRRYAFANDVIEDLELTVYEWPPAASAVLTYNGITQVVHQFQTGPASVMTMPVDFLEVEGMKDFACAIDILNRPKGTFIAPWDVLFIGIKASDTSETHPELAPPPPVARPPGSPALAYPLRHWTDADIWAYTHAEGVPYQSNRYEEVNGEWRERDDKTSNPDYLIGCNRCLRPAGPANVFCPRLQREIPNVSAQVPVMDNLLPQHLRKE